MDECCGPNLDAKKDIDPKFVRALWIALLVNAVMFFVEIGAGLRSQSSALTADAIDFLGDSINYASSLFVINHSQKVRAWLSISKGATMLIYGLVVFSLSIYRAIYGSVPEFETMGITGFIALAANTIVGILLYQFRKGDSNMQSVWICTRNDMIGNVAVILAAGGVFATATQYPDVLVAVLMAALGIQGAVQVIKAARSEL